MIRTYATLTLIALTACSGSDTKYDYSKCGEPARFERTDPETTDGDGGGLALPKGVETDIGLKLVDADGDLCDLRGIEITFDDPSQIEVVSTDEDIVLKANYDAIDMGGEPQTLLHAALGDVSTTIAVASVIALGGTWDIVITETTRFPDGYPFAGAVFSQHARYLRWEDCTVPLVCERDALVRGRDFLIEAPDIGLMISAPIADDRRSFSGPWSAKDGDYAGDFTAVRVD